MRKLQTALQKPMQGMLPKRSTFCMVYKLPGGWTNGTPPPTGALMNLIVDGPVGKGFHLPEASHWFP